MPTSAERFAVDASVAVAAVDGAHAAHEVCVDRARRLRPWLAGHAAFETFSVLTRMPGQLAVDAPTAASVIARAFPDVCWPSADEMVSLLRRMGPLGITGGAVYDALVGEAARADGRILLTRDHRARRTYDLLGVAYEMVDP
jgi:predicted nucleic acid-binding protein